MRRILVSAFLIAAVLTSLTAAAAQSAPAHPRVTFIGDSIAAAIALDAAPRTILSRGIELDLEVAVCRRLVGTSCPYQGSAPPTLVDLATTIAVAPTVVVAVGYNDYESTFPQSIETALAALEKAGATKILWLTMREERGQYEHMNDDLQAAAAHHPELTLVDWNMYSRSHPDWFQTDGLHLDYDGAVAMATLVQKSLLAAGVIAVPRLVSITRTLPAGRVGKPYTARVVVRGGAPPITWKLRSGRLPLGLSLRPNGTLHGAPRIPGTQTLTFVARDAAGQLLVRRVALVVRPGEGR